MTKSHLHDTVYLHHILPYGASLKNLFSGIKTSHYFPVTIHICPLSFKPDIFLAGIILVVSLSMCAVWPGYSPSEKLFRSKTPAQRLIFWWGLKTPFFFFFFFWENICFSASSLAGCHKTLQSLNRRVPCSAPAPKDLETGESKTAI